MEGFKGKTAIITGGGSGIGRALCQELGRLGGGNRTAFIISYSDQKRESKNAPLF